MKAARVDGDQIQQTRARAAERRSIPVLRCAHVAHRHLYEQVQRILASAKSVTVVCGAGISTSAGIPDFRSAEGLYNRELPELRGIMSASELFDEKTLQVFDKFTAFGRVMADFRMQARSAGPTACHLYITKLHEARRLLRCYTQNIDGLQTRGRSDMSEVVLELHGSNVSLSCHKCHRHPSEDVQVLDELLRKEGYVQCSGCTRRGEATGSMPMRQLRKVPPGYLVPDIVFNQDSREFNRGGKNLDQIQKADGRAELLLVIGTSITADGTAKLVRSLANSVHRAGGAVVYIDRKRLPASKWASCFDLHLETDLDAWAADASKQLAARRQGIDVGREVASLALALDRANNEALPPTDSPPDQHLPGNGPRTGGEDKRSAYCLAMISQDGKTNLNRLMLLVCHSGAAASLAQALAMQLALSSQRSGWECRSYVVILSGSEQLSSQVPEWSSYQLLVVHLSDYVFRLGGPCREAEPGQGAGQLLHKSVSAFSDLGTRSEWSTAVMICAEGELLADKGVLNLDSSFRSQCTFKTMITSLNLSRFRTGSWVAFLLRIVNTRGRSMICPIEQIVEQWMTNDELFNHSDLVIFAVSVGAVVVLASEFSERPFGRPLPNIDSTCPCVIPVGASHRKAWEVNHDAEHACAVKDVTLTVRCSLCRRSWRLPTADLIGEVRKKDERYCVQIGYEAQRGWF